MGMSRAGGDVRGTGVRKHNEQTQSLVLGPAHSLCACQPALPARAPYSSHRTSQSGPALLPTIQQAPLGQDTSLSLANARAVLRGWPSDSVRADGGASSQGLFHGRSRKGLPSGPPLAGSWLSRSLPPATSWANTPLASTLSSLFPEQHICSHHLQTCWSIFLPGEPL